MQRTPSLPASPFRPSITDLLTALAAVGIIVLDVFSPYFHLTFQAAHPDHTARNAFISAVLLDWPWAAMPLLGAVMCLWARFGTPIGDETSGSGRWPRRPVLPDPRRP